MELILLDKKFAVYTPDSADNLPMWVFGSGTFMISKVEGSMCIIAEEECGGGYAEAGLRIIKAVRNGADAMVDIMRVLKNIDIYPYIISAYDAEYFLIKDKNVAKAVKYLRRDGHDFV